MTFFHRRSRYLEMLRQSPFVLGLKIYGGQKRRGPFFMIIEVMLVLGVLVQDLDWKIRGS
jgi:hypothetical protein